MESYERNIAQLVRIGAIVDWRWGLKESSQSSNKESEKKGGGDEEGSEKS